MQYSNDEVKFDMELVRNVVAKHLSVTPESMNKKTRKRDVVMPRQIAMYFCAKYKLGSLKAIGEYFSEDTSFSFDHTTVIHSRDTVADLRDTDTDYDFIVATIEKELDAIKNGIGGSALITPEYLAQIYNRNDEQNAALYRFNLKLIFSNPPAKVDDHLQQLGLSRGAAILYHTEFTMWEFREAIEGEFGKSKFTLYVLPLLFGENYDKVGKEALKRFSLTGKQWADHYKGMLASAENVEEAIEENNVTG